MTEAETNPPEHYMGFQAGDELKPCPFCGSRNTVVTTRLRIEDEYTGADRMVCRDCGAIGPQYSATYPGEEEAFCVTAWNTRASEETERAAIVAYLHDGGTTQGCKTATIGLRLRAAWISFRRPWAFPQDGCASAALAIERGEHKEANDGKG